VSKTLAELADLVGGDDIGDPKVAIESVASRESAGPVQIAFLANPRYERQLAETDAAAVIVARSITKAPTNLLTADDPYFAFREVMVAIHGYRQHPWSGIDERASVDPAAELGEGVAVAPFATVCTGARVGARTVLYPGAFVGPGATVGQDCTLHPNATVYDHCVVGDRVILHANVVVGNDGFGFSTHKGAHHKIPQSGIARIEDDVELGAGCCIERAAMGETVIGAGTKFGDLVNIGHGTTIGRHCLLVSQCGISGSVKTGDYVVMGGQVGVAGHLSIGDGVNIGACSAVKNDIPAGMQVLGQPAVDLKTGRKNYIAWTHLGEMRSQLKRLQKRIDQLEGNTSAE
jgi:UDP-3-O-[3-hydroxymyristoyl] glucosamine N-acyltransferase